MPPHCDTLDGPVVKAAVRALDQGDVTLVLPYAPEAAEEEIRSAFESVSEARHAGGEARRVADRYFFETVVRLHRAGEGKPFTGLKPAGLDHGPVIPLAERAIETGDSSELTRLLTETVAAEIEAKLDSVLRLKSEANGDVEGNRRYVSAALGLQVWSHGLYVDATSD